MYFWVPLACILFILPKAWTDPRCFWGVARDLLTIWALPFIIVGAVGLGIVLIMHTLKVCVGRITNHGK